MTGQPHNCYKYLGVYIFTASHEAQTLALAKSEIRSFFTTLQPLRLTHPEYILLVNFQLIPILSYRLIAHPLALTDLGALQAVIWQNICCVVSAVSWVTWLLFTGVSARCVVLRVWRPGPLGPAHRCARWVCCVACAVSWATWLLFTGALARCVALRAPCPGPLGSSSPVVLLCLLFYLCGVLGHLAPVHRCARLACCFVGAVSWASWLLFTCVPARRVPSLCCPRCTRVCGVLALVAPVHWCAR